jgi:hypothetical protein
MILQTYLSIFHEKIASKNIAKNTNHTHLNNY